MREHDDALRSRLIVMRLQHPAEKRPDAQQVEVIRGHDLADHQTRTVAQTERREHRRVAGHVAEDRVLRLEVEKVRIGARGVLITVAAAGEEIDERVGVLDRQRPEQHRVDEREHRGVDTDAEAEREDGHEREAGAAAQPPHGIFEVGQHRCRAGGAGAGGAGGAGKEDTLPTSLTRPTSPTRPS